MYSRRSLTIDFLLAQTVPGIFAWPVYPLALQRAASVAELQRLATSDTLPTGPEVVPLYGLYLVWFIFRIP